VARRQRLPSALPAPEELHMKRQIESNSNLRTIFPWPVVSPRFGGMAYSALSSTKQNFFAGFPFPIRTKLPSDRSWPWQSRQVFQSFADWHDCTAPCHRSFLCLWGEGWNSGGLAFATHLKRSHWDLENICRLAQERRAVNRMPLEIVKKTHPNQS